MTTEAIDDLVAGASRLVAKVGRQGHRGGLLLRGEPAWCQRLTDAIFADQEWSDPAWFVASNLTADAGHTLLGREVDAVVVDLRQRCAPDTLGAAVGAIRRGGLLVVWAHPLSQAEPSLFVRRFCAVFSGSSGVATVSQAGQWSEVPIESTRSGEPTFEAPHRSADQARAVAAVVKVAQGRRGRPAVLLSDRGRGKSAALGLGVATLLAERPRTIWLIAPNRAAVAPVFTHAAAQLGIPAPSKGELRFNDGRLVFRAPADLVGPLPEADLVLVDEAAALPIPFLVRLSERYRRLVFATTVHGYEGTGRGFSLRFLPFLEQKYPGGQVVRLETPIRWTVGDPIEAALFDGLLMNAEAASTPEVDGAQSSTVEVRWLSRDALLADEQTLRALFGLLVSAHYRTTPADLRRILDEPQGRLVVMTHETRVVGAAFVMVEGQFEDVLAKDVRAGHRRPHGHLLPEVLSAQMGLEMALDASFWRVVRIAVHPGCRRRGLGRRLLDAIATQGRDKGADCMGATFGVTEGLLDFWTSANTQVVRVGVTPGASSGLVSTIVLRALTDMGTRLVADGRGQFAHELPFALGDPLRDLATPVALALLRASLPADVSLWPDHVWGALADIGARVRSPEAAVGAMWHFALASLTAPASGTIFDDEARALLLRRCLQRHSWALADIQHPPRGRKTLVRLLSQWVARGMSHLHRKTNT